ncbi:unnamed protein product [Amoebophrya sp. A25]|nr:unnamed protein product [Amoebophrya sp. A25]|eukprot:GSA25T00012551001.1
MMALRLSSFKKMQSRRTRTAEAHLRKTFIEDSGSGEQVPAVATGDVSNVGDGTTTSRASDANASLQSTTTIARGRASLRSGDETGRATTTAVDVIPRTRIGDGDVVPGAPLRGAIRVLQPTLTGGISYTTVPQQQVMMHSRNGTSTSSGTFTSGVANQGQQSQQQGMSHSSPPRAVVQPVVTGGHEHPIGMTTSATVNPIQPRVVQQNQNEKRVVIAPSVRTGRLPVATFSQVQRTSTTSRPLAFPQSTSTTGAPPQLPVVPRGRSFGTTSGSVVPQAGDSSEGSPIQVERVRRPRLSRPPKLLDHRGQQASGLQHQGASERTTYGAPTTYGVPTSSNMITNTLGRLDSGFFSSRNSNAGTPTAGGGRAPSLAGASSSASRAARMTQEEAAEALEKLRTIFDVRAMAYSDFRRLKRVHVPVHFQLLKVNFEVDSTLLLGGQEFAASSRNPFDHGGRSSNANKSKNLKKNRRRYLQSSSRKKKLFERLPDIRIPKLEDHLARLWRPSRKKGGYLFSMRVRRRRRFEDGTKTTEHEFLLCPKPELKAELYLRATEFLRQEFARKVVPLIAAPSLRDGNQGEQTPAYRNNGGGDHQSTIRTMTSAGESQADEDYTRTTESTAVPGSSTRGSNSVEKTSFFLPETSPASSDQRITDSNTTTFLITTTPGGKASPFSYSERVPAENGSDEATTQVESVTPGQVLAKIQALYRQEQIVHTAIIPPIDGLEYKIAFGLRSLKTQDTAELAQRVFQLSSTTSIKTRNSELQVDDDDEGSTETNFYENSLVDYTFLTDWRKDAGIVVVPVFVELPNGRRFFFRDGRTIAGSASSGSYSSGAGKTGGTRIGPRRGQATSSSQTSTTKSRRYGEANNIPNFYNKHMINVIDSPGSSAPTMSVRTALVWNPFLNRNVAQLMPTSALDGAERYDKVEFASPHLCLATTAIRSVTSLEHFVTKGEMFVASVQAGNSNSPETTSTTKKQQPHREYSILDNFVSPHIQAMILPPPTNFFQYYSSQRGAFNVLPVTVEDLILGNYHPDDEMYIYGVLGVVVFSTCLLQLSLCVCICCCCHRVLCGSSLGRRKKGHVRWSEQTNDDDSPVSSCGKDSSDNIKSSKQEVLSSSSSSSSCSASNFLVRGRSSSGQHSNRGGRGGGSGSLLDVRYVRPTSRRQHSFVTDIFQNASPPVFRVAAPGLVGRSSGGSAEGAPDHTLRLSASARSSSDMTSRSVSSDLDSNEEGESPLE